MIFINFNLVAYLRACVLVDLIVFHQYFRSFFSFLSREVVLRWGSSIKKEIDSSPNNKISCNSLIFAIGPVACGFLQKHCIRNDDQPVGILICGLNETDRNTLSQHEVYNSSCFVHRIKSAAISTLVVLWHHEASPVQLFALTDKLFQYLPSDNFKVVILSTSHVSKFRTANKEALVVPFVRSLATDVENESTIFPKLEIPNIITGLPANVLSYCQIHNIPATLFVGYTEDTSADSINLAAFTPLLSAPMLGNFLWKTTDDFKPIPLDTDRGNLYM